MKLGFNGGATIRWNTEPNLGIQAELNFTQHGWEEKFEEKPQYKYSRTVNYMELPFLTHIHFGSKRVRVFVIHWKSKRSSIGGFAADRESSSAPE